MMYRSNDGSENRPPVTPQLALRVTILGVAALVLFAVVFFRLWYLQVLSGDRFLAEANDNRVREIKVHAPRGRILDRNGQVLVDNRTGLAVQLQNDRLPQNSESRERVLRRLGRTIDMSPKRIEREIKEQLAELPFSPVTLRHDVKRETVYYLQENQRLFPGVEVARVFLRRYPRGTTAAHTLGHVGEINPDQLKKRRNRDREQGDTIGQAGIELTYDRFLRGRNGATRVQVDANGQAKGELRSREAEPGDNLRLTLDLKTQRAGEKALAGFGKPGGFVAMNPKNGEVLALGSGPAYNPKIYTRRLTQKTYKSLVSEANGAPITNRATQAAYPTGSTFKAISSIAGLQEGLITSGTTINDPGVFRFGGRDWINAGRQANGTVDLRKALRVSSDVYYYRLGLSANGKGNGNSIQKWARRLSLGGNTGIDLPAESAGLVPDRAWRDKLFKDGGTDRPWSAGDNMNFAVGQGDLQANPLQMAVAYSAIFNRGVVRAPQLGLRVEEPGGRPIQEIKPRARRRLKISEDNLRAVKEGLRAAAMSPGGTSYGLFGNWPFPIAGKTGTAETPKGDQSWYVAAAPYKDPEIVVAFTVEGGGFGADSAAPAVRRMLAAYFDVNLSKLESPAPSGSTTAE
ncbi:MAG: penicillin-binding protein 2 [Solirubrobacterales bacterium]